MCYGFFYDQQEKAGFSRVQFIWPLLGVLGKDEFLHGIVFASLWRESETDYHLAAAQFHSWAMFSLGCSPSFSTNISDCLPHWRSHISSTTGLSLLMAGLDVINVILAA